RPATVTTMCAGLGAMVIGWSGPGVFTVFAGAVMVALLRLNVNRRVGKRASYRPTAWAKSPTRVCPRGGVSDGRFCPPYRLIPLAQIVGRRRRAPDVARHRHPDLRLLRLVAMPRPRIEVAERLVQHLVEFGEKLDDLVVRVAVIGEDVVTWTVPARSPDD